MSLFKKLSGLALLFTLTACGFRPLYVGQGTADSISGKQLVTEMASVFIDEIPNREGQVLRQTLLARLSPLGEPEKPHYRLSIRLSEASIFQQGLRQDNLATRYVMSYTAYYTLLSYPENKSLLKDKTVGRISYDVQLSPYATDVAERTSKERVMKIIGDDIALRLAAFLKSYDVTEAPEK